MKTSWICTLNRFFIRLRYANDIFLNFSGHDFLLSSIHALILVSEWQNKYDYFKEKNKLRIVWSYFNVSSPAFFIASIAIGNCQKKNNAFSLYFDGDFLYKIFAVQTHTFVFHLVFDL